jgi:hypothetical protein
MNALPTGANAPTNRFPRGANAYSNTLANGVPTSANAMRSNPPYTPGADVAPSGLSPSGRFSRPPSRNAPDSCCRRAAP